jgi:hypothetical protein
MHRADHIYTSEHMFFVHNTTITVQIFIYRIIINLTKMYKHFCESFVNTTNVKHALSCPVGLLSQDSFLSNGLDNNFTLISERSRYRTIAYCAVS